MPLIRYKGRLLLLAAFFAVTWVLWPRSSAVGQPAEGETVRATEVKFHGAGSCSSMACHHFNGPEGEYRSEYSTWANGDKHSKAFTVLYNDRSVRIVRNLASDPAIKKKKGSTEALPATEQPLCLKCHATNDGDLHSTGERFALADGVGCEACHGPAQKYLTAHYQAGFKELSPEDKESHYGMKNIKNLEKRADLCISCHVGNETKEVNHDLIAAGHPRLNFELAGYHGIYHKHWSDLDEKARNKDYYARLWLLGQLKTSKAALDLLAVRAETSTESAPEKRRPWPEFSEYACFACHKDLKVDSPSQKSDYYKTRHPGSLPFGRWYLADIDQPLTGDPGFIPVSVVSERNTLRKLMEGTAPPAKEVAVVAKEMSRTLETEIQKLSTTPLTDARLQGLLRKYVAEGSRRGNDLSWDEATQFYLTVAALSQGLTDMGTPTLVKGKGRDELTAIRDRLRTAFPKKDFDSPKNYDPLASPTLADQLKALELRLGR